MLWAAGLWTLHGSYTRASRQLLRPAQDQARQRSYMTGGGDPPTPPLAEVPLAFTGCGVGRVWGKETSSFGVEPLIGCPCSRDVSTIMHM